MHAEIAVNPTFVKLHEDAVIPTKATSGSAGNDLSSLLDCTVEAEGKLLVRTGIAMKDMPHGCYGRIAPRSGMSWKNHTDVGAGVVDKDYTGEIKVVLFNHSKTKLDIKAKDRIAQLIFERCVENDKVFEAFLDENGNWCKRMVQDLSTAEERGARGFGSSGGTSTTSTSTTAGAASAAAAADVNATITAKAVLPEAALAPDDAAAVAADKKKRREQEKEGKHKKDKENIMVGDGDLEDGEILEINADERFEDDDDEEDGGGGDYEYYADDNDEFKVLDYTFDSDGDFDPYGEEEDDYAGHAADAVNCRRLAESGDYGAGHRRKEKRQKLTSPPPVVKPPLCLFNKVGGRSNDSNQYQQQRPQQQHHHHHHRHQHQPTAYASARKGRGVSSLGRGRFSSGEAWDEEELLQASGDNNSGGNNNSDSVRRGRNSRRTRTANNSKYMRAKWSKNYPHNA